MGILEWLAVLGQDQWWPDDSPNGQGEEDWKRVQDVEVDLCRSELAIVSLSVLDDSEDRSHLTRRGSVMAGDGRRGRFTRNPMMVHTRAQ